MEGAGRRIGRGGDVGGCNGAAQVWRKFPIGIQTFHGIGEEGFHCVDGTGHVLHTVRKGGHHFLSRPRRFGKKPPLTREGTFWGRRGNRFEAWQFTGYGAGRSAVRCLLRFRFSDGNYGDPERRYRAPTGRSDMIEEDARAEASAAYRR